jgi:hypothetical protein
VREGIEPPGPIDNWFTASPASITVYRTMNFSSCFELLPRFFSLSCPLKRRKPPGFPDGSRHEIDLCLLPPMYPSPDWRWQKWRWGGHALHYPGGPLARRSFRGSSLARHGHTNTRELTALWLVLWWMAWTLKMNL